MQREIPLSGGNASTDVVRVGDTVRKLRSAYSAGVLSYMQAMRDRGVDTPEPLGFDARGRVVTEFVPGPLAMDPPAPTHARLHSVGTMVRAIHDASEGLDADTLGLGPALIPTAEPDLVCHGDLTPWNLVTGDRWVFIDWDASAVSTRLWDLAYSAQAFTLNDADADPLQAASGLQAFVDGYGAGTELRIELAETLHRRAWAMHDLLETSYHGQREPWGSMYVDGHGTHWRAIAQYLQHNVHVWRTALTPL